MSPRHLPTLTASEVRQILSARGFVYKRSKGSHEIYEGMINGQRRVVTVDENEAPFEPFILRSMIEQSGLTRDDFYASTKKTAKKIGVECSVRSGTPDPSESET